MFTDTINKCAANAARIARLSANHPLSFWISTMMAGAYVGLWFGHHSDAYTLAGIGHNLLWVTLGNTLSGVVFMGLGYWYATPQSERPAPEKANKTERLAQ